MSMADYYVLTDNDKKYYGHFNSLDNTYAEIKKQIKQLNFKPYYYRQNMLEDGVIWLDYGSHTHFFYITPATMIIGSAE